MWNLWENHQSPSHLRVWRGWWCPARYRSCSPPRNWPSRCSRRSPAGQLSAWAVLLTTEGVNKVGQQSPLEGAYVPRNCWHLDVVTLSPWRRPPRPAAGRAWCPPAGSCRCPGWRGWLPAGSSPPVGENILQAVFKKSIQSNIEAETGRTCMYYWP